MNKLKLLWYKLRYPENVFYGNGLKKETAIKSVGVGWKDFIENLYQAKPNKTNVLQVKEKWGGLRFYISSAPEWYFDLIDYYEYKSYRTCEACGEKGKIREDLPWVRTLCNKHYMEEKK